MLSEFSVRLIVYASMISTLCVGFTLTHMIEKFPNFAHADYASIGSVVAYTLVRFYGFNPYASWPPAALVGGLIGAVLYILIVKPLRRTGGDSIRLAFAMFVLSRILATLVALYSFWVLARFRIHSRGFTLRPFDFHLHGYPGILFIAPTTALILVALLHLFLTRSRLGIAMRAVTEDPALASCLGINVFRVHLLSWFLTGSTAALAGAVLSLSMSVRIGGAEELLITIFAGSVLGGLENIYGAVVGGFAVAFIQKILPGIALHLLGSLGIWIAGFEALTPIVVLITILMLEPGGLTALVKRRE
ncbi:MAG: branched-chain amino acid ABC transporter permease [Candidatus Bathyarchaeota archaeon B23]|nr:MAG: branched-chain amino acid ABC transporter permease [Candidatus Bathyarchaeota archaeon B23]